MNIGNTLLTMLLFGVLMVIHGWRKCEIDTFFIGGIFVVASISGLTVYYLIGDTLQAELIYV